MIHLLEVGPEMTPGELKKLSRRYAMTGGYELGLRKDLKPEDLETLGAQHTRLLKTLSPKGSTYRSNNSYRILRLISEHPDIPQTLKHEILELIS